MIVFDHVSLIYPSGIEALKDISFQIHNKERIVLYGPSGSGKTTILSLLAGLIKPTKGEIHKEQGQTVRLVFQEDRLFDHLSVYENIAFGLDRSKFNETEIESLVREIADLTRTDTYLGQRTSSLSGGQRQRVAIARALVSHPKLLLMDEAFNHLDPELKKNLIFDLIQWLKDLEVTLVFVSHDFQESLLLANRMIVLEHSKIAQIGSPESIEKHPATIDIASSLSLLGMNEWKGHIIAIDECSFEKKKGWIEVSGWIDEEVIEYKDRYLHVGRLEEKIFCVLSDRPCKENCPIYINL
ncbi:hypothetical protein C815_02189 [Firmicutes bacterium M10-2]|nr:hypothetical protein C815_02189 [Firmicutes bacterium M10-2]